RLVLIQPLADRDRPTTRLGSIVVEQALTEEEGSVARGDAFVLSDLIVRASIRPAVQFRIDTSSLYAFAIPSPGVQLLVTGQVAPSDIEAARRTWRERTYAASLTVVAVTLLLCCAALLEYRRRASRRSRFLALTAAIITLLISARVILRVAVAP